MTAAASVEYDIEMFGGKHPPDFMSAIFVKDP
jgi:hypothetical protein